MFCEKRSLTLPSSNEKDTLHLTVWSPQNPAAVLQIIHGMADYTERYDELADAAVEQGLAVCGNDHMGHGRTAPTPESLGFFAERDGWRYLIEDEQRTRLLMQQRFPGLPYFLLGQSMGSLIARNCIAQPATGLAGCICVGVSSSMPSGKLALQLVNREIRLHGPQYRSDTASRLLFAERHGRFSKSEGEYAWMTRDTEQARQVQRDPLCTFVPTVSAVRDYLMLLAHATARSWPEQVDKALPLLLLSGSMDPMGQYGKGVARIRCQLLKAGMEKVDCKVYPGARHALLQETNRQQVYEDLFAWMRNQMGG